MAEPTKEPGPWELYRGIERIEKALKDQASSYVTTTAFTLEKQILLSMIADVKEGLTEEKARNDQIETAQKADRVRQDEAKSRTRLMWVTIFASPFAAAIVLWVLTGGLQNLGGAS